MKIRTLGKLGNRLLHSIIVTAIIIFIIIVLSAIAIRIFLNANITGQRSLDFIDESATELYEAVINQEIGQRGYSLTNDEKFLESYYEGLDNFSESSSKILLESKKYPLLKEATEDLVEKGRNYKERYVDYYINLTRSGKHVTDEQLLESEGALEEFRQSYIDYYLLVEDQRSVVRNTMRFRINSILISIVVAVSLIIAINVIVNINILKSVIRPIIDLSNSVKAYTEHDFSKQVPVYQKNDELYDLIQNVDIMRSELSNNIQSLEHMANIDPLTGLFNRRYFNEHLESQWEWAKNHSKPVSLILLDIDHYKLFNDTYGHLAGDECLKNIAQYLSKFNDLPFNVVSRYGGEEFCLLILSRPEDEVIQLSEQIREEVLDLKIPHPSSPTNDFVTISIGIASVIPNDKMTTDDLIVMADHALYHSKNNGRNQVTIYHELEHENFDLV